MKISKSKKELARIISENGGWRDGAEWAAQDSKMDDYPLRICFYENKPKISKGDTRWIDEKFSRIVGDGIKAGEQIPNWHQTILSRAEYFHLYPAPDADGWIEWNGGACPVGGLAVVEVKYAEGSMTGIAIDFLWEKKNNIIAYRLHKPEQSDPQCCESVTRSIQEPATSPTLDQLLQDWRNAEDYAKRKQAEADDATEMRDERWQAVQARAGEFGLEISPCGVKREVEPALVITDQKDLRVGDEIKVTGFAGADILGDRKKQLLDADSCTVVVAGDGDGDVQIEISSKAKGCGSRWYLSGILETQWRFIRRP